jgi:hypothetical protein
LGSIASHRNGMAQESAAAKNGGDLRRHGKGTPGSDGSGKAQAGPRKADQGGGKAAWRHGRREEA